MESASRLTSHRGQAREQIVRWALFSCALFGVLAMISIACFLFATGVPFMARVGFGSFFLDSDWRPLGNPPLYGIAGMLLTTILVTLLSTAIGGALGLLTAMALFKFVPRQFKRPVSFAISILSGIPSVIYGLFGMTVIVPFLRDYISPNGVGYGILAASIVLSIMILPTMVSFTLDALEAVNPSYYEGALALGASREMACFKVVMPAAKSGIFASLVLSSGRAMGETMAVIMVIGGRASVPTSLFQSTLTLTGAIAMGATEYTAEAKTSLIAVGVVLFVLTLLLNAAFMAIKGRDKKC